MSAIDNDAANDIELFSTAMAPSDGEAAFLKSFEDEPEKKKAPSVDEDATDDEATHDDADDTDGSDESPDEDSEDDVSGDDTETTPAAEKKYVDDDGHFVKIKVGDQEQEVAVKDLKRLFGQEASLTQKSTEVANARKAADAETTKHVTALNVLLNRATEKANPYRNIDWMAVSKDPNISAEAASALRDEAKRALDDESFLGQNLNAFMGEVQQRQGAERVEHAKSCIKTLTTPPSADAPNENYIKGWSDKTYEDIRAFAIKQGMPKDIVNGTTDPAAIKLMHMAMLFKRGASKVATTKAVNKTPQKIVKSSSSPSAQPSKGTVGKASALKNLKATGSQDAAVDAFLASFED